MFCSRMIKNMSMRSGSNATVPNSAAAVVSMRKHGGPLVEGYHCFGDSIYFHIVQRSDDGLRVRKFFYSEAELASEYYNMQMFHCLASSYSSGPPTIVRAPSPRQGIACGAIEMDYVGESMGNLFFDKNSICSRITANELALCLMQSIEVILLLDNTMRMRDVNTNNICFTGRGAAIRLHFIDLEKWQTGVWVRSPKPKDEDHVMHSNILDLVQNLWSETACISPEHLEIAELVYQALLSEADPKNVRILLQQLSETLLRWIEVDAQQSENGKKSSFLSSAEMINYGIVDLVTIWRGVLWDSKQAHQRAKALAKRREAKLDYF